VHHNPYLIFSVGTHVVTLRDIIDEGGRRLAPRGSVGVITKSPNDLQHSYRVRFPDGLEQTLRPDDVVMLAQFKEGQIGDSSLSKEHSDLVDRVIYRCVIGSRAYGLDQVDSDVDYRGIYLPTAEAHWSLVGVPNQVERHETQEHYWELQRFLVLALKANPNVLECLYSPLVEKTTPLADELLGMRSVFLSRLVYQTFNGYVLSQFRKIQSDLRNQGEVKWKHVMHLIRLLISGIDILRDKAVTVRVDQHRESLLAIRRGDMPFNETEAWRLSLHAEFDQVFAQTELPERPDYERANAFLLRARRAALSGELP
jgi:predicted nucleotidyltransferase